MVSIPRLQVRLTHAKLHVDADLGQYEMKQPRPTFELKQNPATLTMEQPRGDLQIDQTKAWDALGRTNILTVMDRIYSQARNIAMEGIAKIAERGDQMAAVHTKANAIADIAADTRVSFPEMQYAGEASYDNVDITYTMRKPIIHWEQGGVELNTQVNPPEVEYHRGKLDIYMRQYPAVEMIPPQIDMKV